MSTNQPSLVQALATVEDGNWTPIAVFVPNAMATQTIQLAIPINSPIENPIIINQTVTDSSETNVSSTDDMHSGIVCKKFNTTKSKPLRGNVGGVLLRDINVSPGRLQVTNSRVCTQTTSTVIRKPVYAAAGESIIDNEMESRRKNELFFRCTVCGALSRPNVATCINCRAPFPPNPKYYTKGAGGETAVCRVELINNTAEQPKQIITQKSFYGKALQTMGYSIPLRLEACTPKKKKTPIKRPRIEQPECLTISSDDEGHESREDKTEDEPESENNSATLGAMDGENVDDNFHITDHPYAESAENNRGTPRPLLAQFQISIVRLTCRSIRIGSHKVGPGNLVEFTGDHIKMTLPTASSDAELVSISIHLMNVAVIAHFGKMLPLLVLYTTPSSAIEICSRLKMTCSSGPYFDPSCEDETKKRIIILPENLTDENRVAVKILLKNYTGPRLCHKEEVLLREIDQKSANDLLIRSTPQELVAQLNKLTPNKRGRMSAKDKDAGVCFARTPVIFPLAKHLRKTEILKVATYPPPPETGGITITSEDVFCLEPGEFLNDVIIDFYLKYVLLEKLSEEDRNRTHIFSSFFYGRLTHPGMPSQQSIRSSQEAEDQSLPAAERRHSRVKTWTRHVDIFEKDFIIVPINENSHWLLAIICFPYLVGCNPELETDDSSNNENEEVANDLNTEEPVDTSQQNGSLTTCDDPPTPGIKTERQTRSQSLNNKKQISKPCILIFDSLHTRSWTKYVVNLREYLRIEWQSKKSSSVTFDKTTLKGSYPIVPQQTNYSDCGVYVLQYVDSFFDNPIKDFTVPIREIGDWFSEEIIVKKRDEVKQLISKLQREQNECVDNGSSTNEGVEQSRSVSPSDATTELQEALATISDSKGASSPFNLKR